MRRKRKDQRRKASVQEIAQRDLNRWLERKKRQERDQLLKVYEKFASQIAVEVSLPINRWP